MSCEFSPEHYRTIINNALGAGYEFIGFNEACPDAGMCIYLRHDIDLSISCALEMAQTDASLGVRSTFLFLENSPFYNLLEDKSIEAIYTIKEKGHWIGLHVDLPGVLALDRFSAR